MSALKRIEEQARGCVCAQRKDVLALARALEEAKESLRLHGHAEWVRCERVLREVGGEE